MCERRATVSARTGSVILFSANGYGVMCISERPKRTCRRVGVTAKVLQGRCAGKTLTVRARSDSPSRLGGLHCIQVSNTPRPRRVVLMAFGVFMEGLRAGVL